MGCSASQPPAKGAAESATAAGAAAASATAATIAVAGAVAPAAGTATPTPAPVTSERSGSRSQAMSPVRTNRSRAASEASDYSDGITFVSRKSTRNMTLQAAGHTGNVLRCNDNEEDKQPAHILKKLEPDEALAYERMYENDFDPIHTYVARFFGEVAMDPPDEAPDNQAPDSYIRLSNLLKGFARPFVMDCKVGVRSFAESECKSAKPRPDLLQRMEQIKPNEATTEEKEAGFITKHRWMTFRDRLSSTHSLGIRVDGITGPNVIKLQQSDFASSCERHQVVRELLDFLPPPRWRTSEERKAAASNPSFEASRPPCETEDIVIRKLELARLFRERIAALQAACEASPFFQRHEFVGTSLLLAVEASPPKAEGFLIDFAKTCPVPDGISVDHRSPWVLGNHEDGVLFGLENCTSCWDEVIEVLSAELAELTGKRKLDQ